MVMKIKKDFKRIGVDVVGWICIVLAFALGWLPGPGGTPLLLTGLGLLSIHNEWAHKALHYLKTEGMRLADIVFPDRKIIALIWDIALVGLAIAAVIIYRDYEGIIATVASSAALAVALYIFTLNRKRVEKLIRRYQNRTKQKR